MRPGRIVGNSLVVFSARAGVALLNLVFGVLVARMLGPSGKGTFELLVLFPVMLATVTGAGLRPALTYFLARQDVERGAVVSEGIRLGLRALVAALVVSVVAVPVAARTVFDGTIPRVELAIALASFPAALLSSTGVAIVIGLRQFRLSSTLELVRAGTRVATVAGVLVFKATPANAILGYALAEAAVGIGSAIVLSGRNDLDRYVATAPSLRRDIRNYARQGYLANIVGFLGYRLDIFLVGAFLPAREVGFYVAAVAVAERLWLPSQAIASVLLPQLTASSPGTRQRETERAGRVTLTITLVAGCVVWIGASPIIELLYSSSFLPAVGSLRWLLPGIVTMALARMFSARIAAEGAVKTNSRVSGAALVVNVALNLILIPLRGIEGAAIASTISYTVDLVLRAWIMHRSNRNQLSIVRMLKPARWGDLHALALNRSTSESEGCREV